MLHLPYVDFFCHGMAVGSCLAVYRKSLHTHTHTHTQGEQGRVDFCMYYIYIYMCVCVCVCVFIFRKILQKRVNAAFIPGWEKLFMY